MSESPFNLIRRLVADSGEGPDWTRWEDEHPRAYVIRLVSQVVFAAGVVVDKFGAGLRDRLWGWADRLLDVAHPPQPPVEFDID